MDAEVNPQAMVEYIEYLLTQVKQSLAVEGDSGKASAWTPCIRLKEASQVFADYLKHFRNKEQQPALTLPVWFNHMPDQQVK